MNIKMLDFLVCPFDKESTLELFEFKTRPINSDDHNNKLILDNPNSQTIIQKKDKTFDKSITKDKVTDIVNTHNKIEDKDKLKNKDIIIEEGILFCNSCSRYYPIVDEIPIMLPDNLRDKVKDLEMLSKWQSSLPEKIFKKGFPWHL
jgi:uncharacterized protein